MRVFRRRLKMTQERAAKLLDVTKGTYQVWESRRGTPPAYWKVVLLLGAKNGKA